MWSVVFGTAMFPILLFILIFMMQRTSMTFKSWYGILRMLEVSDWCLVSWSRFLCVPWSLINPRSKFQLSILILKVQRTSMSFKSLFGALEDAGGSWLGFGMLILIWIWSMFFYTSMFRILFLYVDFELAKNIHVL